MMKRLISITVLVTASTFAGATHHPVGELLTSAAMVYDASVNRAIPKMVQLRCSLESDHPEKEIVKFDTKIIEHFNRDLYAIQLAYLMSQVCFKHTEI